MAVYIKNVLSLNVFKDARVLTGHKNLGREIRQMTFADNPLDEEEFPLPNNYDLNISSLHFAKDSLDSMMHFFSGLVETNASGVCISNEYMDDLPEEIREYCEKSDFPVIIYDKNIPYAQIIKEVMELIILDQQESLLNNKIELILNDNINDLHRREILNELNPHFESNLFALYILPKDRAITNSGYKEMSNFINSHITSFGMLYNQGLLGLVSYQHRSDIKLQNLIDYYVDKLTGINPHITIGIGSLENKLADCSKSIKQAITANKFHSFYRSESSVAYYDNMGIVKLIMLLNGEPELEEYCKSILDPILEFDKKNNTHLYKTMKVFVKNNNNYKKTSEEMFLHDNTVRYRINKVKEIITSVAPYDDFTLTFSIAQKIRFLVDGNIV